MSGTHVFRGRTQVSYCAMSRTSEPPFRGSKLRGKITQLVRVGYPPVMKTSQSVITQKYVSSVNDPGLTAALEEVKIRVADKTSSDDE